MLIIGQVPAVESLDSVSATCLL